MAAVMAGNSVPTENPDSVLRNPNMEQCSEQGSGFQCDSARTCLAKISLACIMAVK